ncbi:PCMD domain-containing protein [Alistipes senegalensis]|uniref:PCMD domain-containing protein n=1 Tax=Alistipes senegalensis TaxID=1288121 RepID=UPI0024315409|nr:PCMD domain-containing protein [Alistipes senegalensis]MCI7309106.1 PCMD domain-containing protein [Alistipes senegalensis]MDD7039685.1 PCMD domain-containing protein [Alistipes senegalensis]MDY2877123.1 PCMD domain-containing protein [Alistipes senegalensis]
MTRYLKTAFAAAAALLAASCISNDIPYPVVELRIANVEGEGFSVSENNVTSRVVTLTLDEATDIRNVKIDAVTYDAIVHSIELNKAELLDQVRSSQELTGTFNLLSPIYTTLSLYQDYDWTIRAVQTIERRFSVTGQIGATEIDTENRIVRVYVPDNTDLGHIEIEELKLGPAEITTYSPTLEELSGSSFESVRFVDVTCHGVTERWMLYVETTNVKVALREADLWQNTGTVTALISAEEYASGAALEYRIKGDTEWQPMQESGYDAGILTATIAPEWKTETNPNGLTVYKLVPKKGLFAGHTYEFRLLVGGSEQGAPLEYTAPAGNTIPNGDMEDASMSCWTQNNKTAEFWGSGNNTFTKGLCTQASFAGGTRAKLQATSAVGVLASGNLFTGLFQKDLITRGVVSFGQTYAWKARPRALKVQYFAEHIGPVDIDKKFGAPIGMGDQDRARIMVAIVDWNARREVGSGTEPPTGTWDPQEAASTEQGKIIAYGSLFIDESSTGDRMIDTELELHFYDREAKPSGLYQLVISCSTSAYGDFMTGCKSNVLYIDNFEWAY